LGHERQQLLMLNRPKRLSNMMPPSRTHLSPIPKWSW
jgi:hypothetical protein